MIASLMEAMLKKITIGLLLSLILVVPVWAIDNVPAIDQDAYEELWGVDNICGPTVMAEVMGYWANHGYPNLNPNQDIDDVLYDMVYTYCIRDSSGATSPENLISGLNYYTSDAGYEFEIVTTGKGKGIWTDLELEIDSGRPVILLLYDIVHYVVATDYYESSTALTITMLTGHQPLQQTYDVNTLDISQLEMIFVRPVTQAESDADDYDTDDDSDNGADDADGGGDDADNGTSDNTDNGTGDDADNGTSDNTDNGTGDDDGEVGSGGCFIATAAYGSILEPHVVLLREFRDHYLLNNPIGKAFVHFYYKCSPPVADIIADNEFLRFAVSWGLLPMVGLCRLMLILGPAASLCIAILFISGLLGGVVMLRRKPKCLW